MTSLPSGRIPELDGLRAVAVYLVVAFHAGIAQFEGGFIGVDVFFVLSGFLITHVLLTERSRTGRIDLFGFYARRIRRLLPASAVAIVGATVGFAAFASPLERASVLSDARAAVFYVANWHFIGKSEDYFADSLDASPYLHLWSLAVEEQFYLVWPLVMLVVGSWWCKSRGARIQVAVGLGIAVVIGSAMALLVATDSPLRSYYGTDTRAYQLLAGATLAAGLTLRSGGFRRRLPSAIAQSLVLFGLIGIFLIATIADSDPAIRGVLATVATSVLIVGTAARVDNTPPWSSRILGSAPLARLGDLSYATYLWHWPLIVILERTLVLGHATTALLVGVVATGIAHVSMDLVERPIRRRSASADRRANQRAVAFAIGGTLILGLLIVPAILTSDLGQVRSVQRPGFSASAPASTPGSPQQSTATPTPIPDDVLELTIEVPVPSPPTESISPIGVNVEVAGETLDEQDGCVNDVVSTVESCIVVNGPGERILLVGDSHANKLNVMLAEHAVETGSSLATVSMVACPWQRGLLYEFKMVNEGARQVCRDQRTALYDEVLNTYQPDVVIATSHDLTTDAYTVMSSGDVAELDDLTMSEQLEVATDQSVERFVTGGARVVIIEPLPNSPFDPRYCIDAASNIEECAFEIADWPAAETPMYRAAAASDDRVTTADLTSIVCPGLPRCDAVLDGLLVREDLDHLSLDFTRAQSAEILLRLGL